LAALVAAGFHDVHNIAARYEKVARTLQRFILIAVIRSFSVQIVNGQVGFDVLSSCASIRISFELAEE